MKSYTHLGYVVTGQGHVDVNYYIVKAHQLRNKAVRKQTVALVNTLKKLIATMKLSKASQPMANAKPV